MLKIHLTNTALVRREENNGFNPAELAVRFTYPNPLYYENERLGFSNCGVQREICLGECRPEYFMFPRGLVSEVLKFYPAAEVVDRSVVNPVSFSPSRIILKDYQQDALAALLKKNQGILLSPPGSGKTVVGIELITRRGQKALVLVHTLDLLQQWRDRLRHFTSVEPGIIQGDLFEIRDITIGMVQSLTRPLDTGFVNQFGLVLLDEGHHAPAATFQRLIEQFPARYRYGLTATPERRDGLEFIMTACIGRIIHEILPSTLIDSSNILRPAVKIVHTSAYVPVVESYQELIAKLNKDGTRNLLIVAHVSTEAKAGHYCLVLSERVDHARELQRLFTKMSPGVKSFVITGRDSKEKRVQAIDAMNKGNGRVLFSTKLADEGLDIQRLDRLFLTCPVRAVNKVRQQIGRIQRTFPGKQDAVVYDFLDINSLAENQYQTRERLIYSEYEVEHIKGCKNGDYNHEKAM